MTGSLLLFGSPFLKGLMTSAGLIIAIGAQNAFVLSQGLRRQHHAAVAGLCSLIDALLIIAGVAGMGLLISQSPQLLTIATWGGALFLMIYGARALYCAIKPETMKRTNGHNLSLRSALLTTLALSLLNPHVYLDTIILLGSIGGSYPADEQYWFATGAVLASFSWFFALGFGARWLAPLFQTQTAWRVLDLLVCAIMWGLALSLILE